MAERRELGFPKTDSGSLKEQLVRTTLRNVRSQGHTYVELREDGKKLIFFCTLCRSQCYSDSVLFNHLKGGLHTERLAAAQVTLLRPNPWPFNDGVFFFHDDSAEQDKNSSFLNSERIRLLDTAPGDEDGLAIVKYSEKLSPSGNGNMSQDDLDCIGDDVGCDDSPCSQNLNGDEKIYDLIIPGVLQKGEVSDLTVRFMGVGKIGARFIEKNGDGNEMRKIWCEWLGKKIPLNKDADMVPDHDFAAVIFSYNYSLGRKGFLDNMRYLLPSSLPSEVDGEGSRNKKRKSFSDPEDISDSLSNQDDSSGEASHSPNDRNSKSLLAGSDDQLVHSKVLSSKSVRKEMRRQQRIASERLCDICQQKMLPSKDVAALLNRNTGRLVCSSRNLTGAFHVFHISCLIQWILLCEFETYSNQSVAPKMKRRSKRKTKSKDTRKQIYSAFCPECQGTGMKIDGEELEKPTVPLSEMFRYKIKISDAHKAWMKSPEVLQNCSVGFHFSPHSEDIHQENVSALKLLHFYRIDD